MATKPPLGSGRRFSALAGELAKRPGVRNPRALAASIGRKTYGKSKMEELSEKGRRDKERGE